MRQSDHRLRKTADQWTEKQPTIGLVGTTTLLGVESRVAEKLRRLSIYSADDILLHLPMRYQDRSQVTPIIHLVQGAEAQIEAEIIQVEVIEQDRRFLLCHLRDSTGSLTLRFFHFNKSQQLFLRRPGIWLRCFGEVRQGYNGLEMIHPQYCQLDINTPPVPDRLTPVYPSTAGLRQTTMRTLTKKALLQMDEGKILPELLPSVLLVKWNLMAISDAVRLLHQPPSDTSPTELSSCYHPARRRLAFEEILAHQLSLRRLREKIRQKDALPLYRDSVLAYRFCCSLPFSLTAAQKRVVKEINTDLTRPRPMLRLLQGDVGSGKTVVAALAALRAVENGAQAALMVPTELLAEQHYHNFRTWLGKLGIEVAWLSGRLNRNYRRTVMRGLTTGDINIVIGTHALFQEEVEFANLALAIVDEQHRFGVHQRLALSEKGRQDQRQPHQLIMTATPIPRTLAMSVYADLDTSLIDELPPGRQRVRTVAVPENRRAEVVNRIRQACWRGRQAYWVCPFINESAILQCQAACLTAELLAALLPEFCVRLVHGRMPSADRETIFKSFKAGEINLLVATTVIEVGIDVPNATMMIVENSERLGLAQLHQLRGRVGRSNYNSSCVLLYRPPLSQAAYTRLSVLRECSNGFDIANRDLELRGPGEILGIRQAGIQPLRFADLTRDNDLLHSARCSADWMLHEHPDLVEKVIQRWINADARYGEV
jgi:ATP-dependent DNA helicase RecG